MSEIYQDIPCWDNGTWTTISFESREEFSRTISTIQASKLKKIVNALNMQPQI